MFWELGASGGLRGPRPNVCGVLRTRGVWWAEKPPAQRLWGFSTPRPNYCGVLGTRGVGWAEKPPAQPMGFWDWCVWWLRSPRPNLCGLLGTRGVWWAEKPLQKLPAQRNAAQTLRKNLLEARSRGSGSAGCSRQVAAVQARRQVVKWDLLVLQPLQRQRICNGGAQILKLKGTPHIGDRNAPKNLAPHILKQ